MKRRLNPDLVWDKRGPDRQFSADEHWVILREPTVSSDARETGIGNVEVEELVEPEADANALKRQIKETETVLSAYAALQPERQPHIILTRDCFGFKGAVRLLIYSVRPFA